MLWLGLLQRETGIPASKHLGIKDEVLALEFNLAATLRLLRFDNERTAQEQKNLSIRIANQVAKLFGMGGDDDILDSDLIGGDRYADSNTVVW